MWAARIVGIVTNKKDKNLADQTYIEQLLVNLDVTNEFVLDVFLIQFNFICFPLYEGIKKLVWSSQLYIMEFITKYISSH